MLILSCILWQVGWNISFFQAHSVLQIFLLDMAQTCINHSGNINVKMNIYVCIYIYIYIGRVLASEWCVHGGGSAVQHKVQCPTGRLVHISIRGDGVCPHPTSMVCHKLWDCTRVQIANVPSRERGILGQGMAIVRHAHRSINQPEQLVLSFV